MPKKLYILLLPVLAVAAMAITAGAAQAAPHWEVWKCVKVTAGTGAFNDSRCTELGGSKEWEWVWERLPNGEAVHVTTFGELTFSVPADGISITCQVLDRGTIENKAAGGVDSVALFENYDCESTGATSCPTPEIDANNLPWSTELEAGPVDKIEPDVTVFCGGTSVGTFTGTLKPEIGNGVAIFNSSTGELTGPGGAKAKVEGEDFIYTNGGLMVRAK